MVASEEPSARLMLFCKSLLRAAPTAATLSGNKISSATTTPANAGGAPIKAVVKSTTSENFFASSTTVSSETTSRKLLTPSIRFEMRPS